MARTIRTSIDFRPMTAPRSRTPLIVGLVAAGACLVLAVALVLVAVIGGALLHRGGDTSTSEGTASEQVAPPGAAADQPYLELSTASDGPTVDVYIDFLCPHCATFHDAQGEDLTQLAQDGEITLRLHPRPMLDGESTPAGYSGRAANAAVCVYAEDPEQWPVVEDALFANQPGAEGLTDEELSALVAEATGLDVTSCITEGTYLPWIEDVVEPEARESTGGTPTVLIDGEQFTGDVSEAGSVKAAVEGA
jgi:protein-disulfide isomerase